MKASVNNFHYKDVAACDLLSQFNMHVLNRDYQTKRLKKSVHSLKRSFTKEVI